MRWNESDRRNGKYNFDAGVKISEYLPTQLGGVSPLTGEITRKGSITGKHIEDPRWMESYKGQARPRTKPVYLYFVQESESKRVKIGISENVVERMHGLQTDNSENLICLGTILFSRWKQAEAVENDVHKLFRKYNIRGEWFEFSPELDKFITRFSNKANELLEFLDTVYGSSK